MEKPISQTKPQPQDSAPVKENFGTSDFERLDKKFKANENSLQSDELARYQAYLKQQPQQKILDEQKAEAKAKSERKQALAANLGAENRLAFHDLIKNLPVADLDKKMAELEIALAQNQKILLEPNGNILTRPKMDEAVEKFAKLQLKDPTKLSATERSEMGTLQASLPQDFVTKIQNATKTGNDTTKYKAVFEALKKEGDAKVAKEKVEAGAKKSAQNTETKQEDKAPKDWSHLKFSTRHHPSQIRFQKKQNTILLVSMDEINKDIAEIHTQGDKIRTGEAFTCSSGRVYKFHDAALYPVSIDLNGQPIPKTIELSGLECKTVGVARTEGLGVALEQIDNLLKNKEFDQEAVDRIWVVLNYMEENNLLKK